MLKNHSNLKIIWCCFSLAVCYLSGFSQNKEDYRYLVDSADFYIDTDSKKALSFLDSIPNPIEQNIKGKLADYYAIKSLIHDDYKEYSKMYQCNILALKYAEKEKNYKVAGQASLDLFTNIYFVKKDSSAYKYLVKAKEYFDLSNYPHGVLEVQQMYAYAKFMNRDFNGCNELILKHLSEYRNVKDDAYFFMFATYMLTVNYIFLGNFEEAHNYFKEFKTLKDNPTITEYNYLSFEASIDISLAEQYFNRKQIDSTLYYLKNSTKLKIYMGEDAMKGYYDLYANFYKNSGDIDKSKAYIDSLMTFKDKIYKNTINASFQINESLLKTESELQSRDKKIFYNEILVTLLFLVLILLSVFYFIFYRKHKEKFTSYNKQNSNLSYLKSNNEQLTVKILGLEGYIRSLKKEVKLISTIEGLDKQREQIKNLYKNLHINSSTLLDKSESHLDLVNDLNVDFFKKIKEFYPQLNNSEVIICYYLFIDFKNKEIAVFLNSSVRAIESKRYRITKKINLEDSTLVQHLKDTFKPS